MSDNCGEPTPIKDLNAPIGIFDSGVGGMSIANAIHRLMPNEQLVYVADNGNAPYGNKPADFVRQRCFAIAEFLRQKKVKLVVVACNTATLACIAQLRAHFDIPFVGAEPGIKPAMANSQSKVVGVMATQSTIESPAYSDLISRLNTDCVVLNQACHGLVECIERGEIESDATFALLRSYVEPFLKQQADHIVLGCTHYGFVSQQIADITGDKVTLVNTSDAIARQTRAVLMANKLQSEAQQTGTMQVFASKNSLQFRHVAGNLVGKALASTHDFTE